jgi:hypothetical protein
MATEKIEIQVLVKGKPAIKAIKGVEKKTEDLGKQAKKTGKDTDGMLTKMKAGWIAVGASVAIAVAKGQSFERMSLGLTKAQKDWAKETALASDIQAEQVAGFLKSAQTAGLAEDKMKSLAKQAIALGYAFPHEDAETLHDNLVMLEKTGEAQGFVVDILEQQYVGLGEEISTLDLKTKSWAEKMELVNNVAKKSQEQMNTSKYKELNEVVSSLDNAFVNVGDTLVDLASSSGGFQLVRNIIEGVSLSIQFIGAGIKTLATDIGILFEKLGIVHEKQLAKNEVIKEELTLEEKLRKAYILRAEIFDSLSIVQGEQLEAAKKQMKVVEEQIVNLNKYGDAQKDSLVRLKESKKAHADLEEQQKNSIDRLEEFGKGWIKQGGTIKDQTKQWGELGGKAADALGTALTNMAMGVKTSFKDMARVVVAELLKIAIMRNIVTPLGNLLFPSRHTGTSSVVHTGGAIGSTRIPSFHTGVRSDERLAKLQVGEAVINRGGAVKNRGAIEAMNKGYAVGGGGGGSTTIVNEWTVNAIDAASFNSYLINNKGTIESIINNSISNNGSVRRTMRQTV